MVVKVFLHIIALLLLVLLSVEPCLAADERNLLVVNAAIKGEKRVALVIGNSAYNGNVLRTTSNDAQDVAAKLRAMGFDVVARDNLQVRQIDSTLDEFKARLAPGSVALVFYAGYGLQVNGENYLPAVDARIAKEDDVEAQSIAIWKIMGLLDEAKTRANIVLLDASRDYPDARSFAGGAGLERIMVPSDTVVSFSALPGRVVPEGDGRNGLYAGKLLKQMDGNLQIEAALKQLAAEIKSVSNGLQEPWVDGSIGGGFCFAGCGKQEQLAPILPMPAPSVLSAHLPPVVVAPVPVAAGVTKDGFRDCTNCPEMIRIPEGSFEMGSPATESEHQNSESPQHRVNIKAFAMSKYKVTFEQFSAFIAESGYGIGKDCILFYTNSRKDGSWQDTGFAQTKNQPVVCVNWNDAQAFVQWLSKKTGKEYRLPREAEWEYAARAGTITARYWGNDAGQKNANCVDCGSQWDNKQTSPAGSFAPNAFGLYDMLGNAWEWTQDCYHSNYTGSTNSGNAWTAAGCTRNVLRGGSWIHGSRYARSASRYWSGTTFRSYFTGFRIARAP